MSCQSAVGIYIVYDTWSAVRTQKSAVMKMAISGNYANGAARL